ncbi:hypothetical protein [Jannaschia aquimarina]|uniref:Late embryogenesis abundant protein n=1 Tax=Jannaschia aquimarina TaxID=935700 RepID=A0A0D1EPC8_9RHOB|nr:hypothetical protein [Jannaschia aquimarina]KIT17525.1 hypothetical protein jaqu_07140 [Jannaschia aquimarina]SNS73737.1 hypothetical protein SAMN05421775_10295 [Jannaschia aquimarina]
MSNTSTTKTDKQSVTKAAHPSADVSPSAPHASGDTSGIDVSATATDPLLRGEAPAQDDQSPTEIAKNTSQAAMSRAEELAAQGRAEAESIAERGKAAAFQRAEEAKARAAGEVNRTADRVRAAGYEFGDDSYPAYAADYIAGTLSDAARAIEERDVRGMVGEVSSFARANPALFLGAAAVLGFAVARMMKATSRDEDHGASAYDTARRPIEPPRPGLAHTPYGRASVRPGRSY